MALSDDQYEFLNFIEQFWFEYGTVPTAEKCRELEVSPALFASSFSNPEFRQALIDRGISVKGLPSPQVGKLNQAKWRDYALTELQLTAANVMLDVSDTRSQKKKLADLGISTQIWQSWLRDPGFQNYLRSRSENLLGDHQHDAHLALVDRVKSGDIGAIKYYNEMTGRFVQNSQANVDVSLILLRVLEIIQKYVVDSALQAVIADEFLSLAEAGGVTNSINQKNVIQGTLIPAAVGGLSGEVIYREDGKFDNNDSDPPDPTTDVMSVI